MHDILQITAIIEKSDHFLAWKEHHPDAFLVSIVLILEADVPKNIQCNYALSSGNEVYACSLQDKEIVASRTLNETKPIELLLPEQLMLDVALQQAYKEKNRQNPNEQITKTLIILLQKSKNELPVWNVTFFTQSLKTINMHITLEGNVHHYDYGTFIDFT